MGRCAITGVGITRFLCVALICALAPAGARAETPREAARPLFQQGIRCFDSKDYDCALKAYRQAYAIFPSPKITLNIALTLEARGDAPGAAEHLERFLLEASRGKGKRRQQRMVDTKLKVLRQKLKSLTLSGPETGAVVLLDGKPRGEAPTSRRLYAAPGKHTLELRKERHGTWRKEVVLQAGATLEVKVPAGALAPVVLKKRVPARPEGKDRAGEPVYKKWWFWTAVGVGVVAVVGGVTAGVLLSPEDPTTELGTITFD